MCHTGLFTYHFCRVLYEQTGIQAEPATMQVSLPFVSAVHLFSYIQRGTKKLGHRH